MINKEKNNIKNNSYHRKNTKSINVKNIIIGGNNHVVIQSMTNTKTKDVKATVDQIKELEKRGCEIIRVACLDLEDAKAIELIKEQVNIPIVADIHFDYKIALQAIDSGVDKIRINPGNIGSIEKIKAVVNKCKEKKIPIRIGINGGSIEKDIEKDCKEKFSKEDYLCEAMLQSAKRHIEILENLDFYDICVSLKCTDLEVFIKVNEKFTELYDYPLHLGLTESGTSFSGTIKSSIGLSALLRQNIGNTIRVSLSDDPIEEIPVAKEILKNHKLYKAPTLIACPTCGRIQYDLFSVTKEIEPFLQSINEDITVAIMGCAVNGPGEAMGADIGLAGGINEAILFKKGKIIKKVKQYEMVEVLKKEILELIEERNK